MTPTVKSPGFPVAKAKGCREDERSLSLTEGGCSGSLLPWRRSLAGASRSRALTSCLVSSGRVRPQPRPSRGVRLRLPADTDEDGPRR